MFHATIDCSNAAEEMIAASLSCRRSWAMASGDYRVFAINQKARLILSQGDITKWDGDAIVNAGKSIICRGCQCSHDAVALSNRGYKLGSAMTWPR
jgi:hypothetical protein